VRNALINHYMPQRVLPIQKRVMRRFMRKPKNWKMRQFMARIREIDGKLPFFPPFDQGQQLDQEELIDIGEFGIPNLWQRQMVLLEINKN